MAKKKQIVVGISEGELSVVIGKKKKVYDSKIIRFSKEATPILETEDVNSNLKDFFSKNDEKKNEKSKLKDRSTILQEEIASKLKDYLNTKAANVKEISFIIRGNDIITRYIEVPIMKEDLLREAMYIEFSQFIPEVEEYYMDYEIIDRLITPDKKVYKTLLVAVVKEKVDMLLKIGESLGRTVDVIDITSNSMLRVLKESKSQKVIRVPHTQEINLNSKNIQRNNPKDKNSKDKKGKKKSKNDNKPKMMTRFASKKDEASAVILYLGLKTSTITIVENNALKLERNIPSGLNNIKEVNTIYFEMGLAQDEVVKNSIQDFFVTISNILRYYNSDRNNKAVGSFIVLMEEPLDISYNQYWETYFNLPCTFVKKPEDLYFYNLNIISFEKNAPNYGVLLREEKGKQLNLNPDVINKISDKANLGNKFINAAATFALLSTVVGGGLIVINNNVYNEISTFSNNIDENQKIVATNSELKGNIEQLSAFIGKVENLKKDRTLVSKVMSSIHKYVPQSVSLVNFSFDNSGVIKISGESVTYPEIAEFLANLQMSEEFSSAKLININLSQKNISNTTNNTGEDSTAVDIVDQSKVYQFNILIERNNKTNE